LSKNRALVADGCDSMTNLQDDDSMTMCMSKLTA